MADRRRWDLVQMACWTPDRGGGHVDGSSADLAVAALTPERRWWCHAIAAACATCFVTPAAIMLFDRRDPIVVEAVFLAPSPAYPGDTLTMRWRAREYRACDGVVKRRFIGARDHIIREAIAVPTVYHGTADGLPRDFEVQFVIPNNLGPGSYSYEPVTIRWCNELQRLLWPLVSYPPPVGFSVVDRSVTTDRGEPGEPGEQGDQGEKGDRGEQGEKGDRGEKGERGSSR